MPARFAVHVTKPIPFVSAVLPAFAGTALLSLEGDLSQVDFRGIAYASHHPPSVLQRNTIWPVQDFVIVPLTNAATQLLVQHVLPHIGLKTRVLHLLIERDEQLVFAAYDQFAPKCVWIAASIGEQFLKERLVERSIKAYHLMPDG